MLYILMSGILVLCSLSLFFLVLCWWELRKAKKAVRLIDENYLRRRRREG